nr:DUF6188 family protein [Streptomyces sp. S-2]
MPPGRCGESPRRAGRARVTRTAFDCQVRISFTDHDPDGRVRLDGEFAIETPITVTNAAGTQAVLFPGTGTALAPLLGLFTKAVTEAEVTGLGTLSPDLTTALDSASNQIPTTSPGPSPAQASNQSW